MNLIEADRIEEIGSSSRFFHISWTIHPSGLHWVHLEMLGKIYSWKVPIEEKEEFIIDPRKYSEKFLAIKFEEIVNDSPSVL